MRGAARRIVLELHIDAANGGECMTSIAVTRVP